MIGYELDAFIAQWELDQKAQEVLMALDPPSQQRVMAGFQHHDVSGGASTAFIGYVNSLTGFSMPSSGPGGFAGGCSGVGGLIEMNTLYISRLKLGATQEELEALFNQACTGFQQMKFIAPAENKWGSCWAQFATTEEASAARQALTMYGLPSNPNESLTVDFAKNNLDQPRGVAVGGIPAGGGVQDIGAGCSGGCGVGCGGGCSSSWSGGGSCGSVGGGYAACGGGAAAGSGCGAGVAYTGGAGRARQTLYISKLKAGATQEELDALFSQACEGFQKMKFIPPDSSKLGACWAQFMTPELAQAARETLTMYGLPSNPSEPLSVDFAKNDLDVPTCPQAAALAPALRKGSWQGGCCKGGSVGVGGGGCITTLQGGKANGAMGRTMAGASCGGKGQYAKDSYGKDVSRHEPYSEPSGKGKGKVKGTSGYTAKQMALDLVESGGLPGGKWKNDENTVYIEGIPQDTTELEIFTIFSPFGAILPGGVSIARRPDGSFKGFAYVNFADADASTAAALTLNDCELPDGTKMRVQPFNPTSKR